MHFPITRWTLIAHLSDEAKAEEALDRLCGAYWQPIHAYLVRSGHTHVQAQDLTQDFLEMVVRQRLLERADPIAGKLRSWLLGALRHFLANAYRYENRQKRGGGAPALLVDHEKVSFALANTESPFLSPDQAFDRAWVHVLLSRVLDQLTRQYRDVGKGGELTALLPWLMETDDVPQTEAAAKAGMTIVRFRVQLHRLRGRYRELLRQEITATLECEDDYDEELAYLFRIVGQPA